MSLKDHVRFVAQSIRDFKLTGAVLPSSRWLSRAMTRHLRDRQKRPWRILEAGAGTGPFTEYLVRHMMDGDKLECYELNPHFCSRLKERIWRETIFQRRAHQVEVLEKDIRALPPENRYDLVVCGLPFNNFPPNLARQVMGLLFKALKPGCSLTYFEYLMIRHAKGALFGRKERENLAKVEEVLKEARGWGKCEDEIVWRNIPPAIVRSITKEKENAKK